MLVLCCGETSTVEKEGEGRKELENWRSALTHASDTIENIERLRTVVEEVPCEEVLGVVVYDLPGRDCAAKASNGELKVGEIERYKTEFIDRESTPSLLYSPGPFSRCGCCRTGTGRPSPIFTTTTTTPISHNKDNNPMER